MQQARLITLLANRGCRTLPRGSIGRPGLPDDDRKQRRAEEDADGADDGRDHRSTSQREV